MLTRRALAGLSLAAVTAAHDALARDGTRVSPLFTIGRSKNANVVRYDARLSAAGLERARPIDAYWLMLAEDGRREELSWTEKKLAYGFSVASQSDAACELRLTAFDARPVRIERAAQGARALVAMAGKRAVLQRIFVQAREGALLPSVEYLDLFGTTLDGAPLREHISAR